uniref:Uncharacterized protein n=1 Tax=Mucochytrium quahogii TaxID=96639 RepID=A0A7S2S6R9_9STRA|mmetsp:Transcript_28989/g.46768  ORF Transcript_28989/g.46768 Transcript_28989/m.46768 type:complete len:284 (-) Transcript_28989:136-987(-)
MVSNQLLVLLALTLTYAQAQNHPVCDFIKNSHWWSARAAYTDCIEEVVTEEIARTDTAELAAACQAKTPLEAPPKGQKARRHWRLLKAAECKATSGCEWIGAGKHVCQYNVCWDRNDGGCTLNQTKGLCVWYKKSDGVRHPETGRRLIGCHKNPCQSVPTGQNQRRDCETSGNNKYQCTWCSFRKATTVLNGKKMGCQIATTQYRGVPRMVLDTPKPSCKTCIDNPACYVNPNCFFEKVLGRIRANRRRCRPRRGRKYCGCRLKRCPNANIAVARITACDNNR